MPHESGSYLKELEEEHRNGDHENHPDDNCPTCRDQEEEKDAREEGFDSKEAYETEGMKAVCEMAVELEDVLDGHRRGEHKDKAHPECIHPVCTSRD